MEKKLHKEFLELREKVAGVKRLWFSLRRRQILNSVYPEIVFKFSDHWFGGFSWRKRVPLTKKNRLESYESIWGFQSDNSMLNFSERENGDIENKMNLLGWTKPLFHLIWLVLKPMIALVQKSLSNKSEVWL